MKAGTKIAFMASEHGRSPYEVKGEFVRKVRASKRVPTGTVEVSVGGQTFTLGPSVARTVRAI